MRPRGPRLALWTWLVISHLLALALPVAAFVGTGAFATDLQMQTRRSLENQAVLLDLLVRAELRQAREIDPQAEVWDVAERLVPALDEITSTSMAGVRVVDLDGQVVASTGPMLGADLSERLEVREALQGRPGSITRPTPPAPPDQKAPPGEPREGQRVYLAVPVELVGPDGSHEVVAALLLSRAPRTTWQVLRNMGPRLDLGAMAALITTLGLATIMGWGFSRSVRRLSRATHRLAEGRGSEGDPDLDRARVSRISEVSELAEDFAVMADRLEARLDYISEFAGNVSHEFKTPISTLRGTLELLEDDPDMPPEQRALFIHNALEELDRTWRLVDGLLALARAEEGRHRDPVDLDAVVASVAGERPEIRIEGTAGRALGDAAQVEAALLNLVDNALSHGGPEVAVTVRAWREGDRCGVDVVDDGVGISVRNQEQVFDRFFTTARGRGGTGLGLALVKAIAQAHGGDVTMESQPGRTRFSLWLPAMAERPQDPGSSRAG